MKNSTNSLELQTKKSISEVVKDKWNSKVKGLTMQGDFGELLIEEQQCFIIKLFRISDDSLIKRKKKG